MSAQALTALLLSDGKPGHYHQAEGVLAAIARRRPVETQRIEVRRRFLMPTRALQGMINAGASPQTVLRLGYGLETGDLPAAQLVVSAGGETLAANAAIARHLQASNIFCGRLRRLRASHVRLVIVSLEEFAQQPNYLVVLPPSPIEPGTAGKTPRSQPFSRTDPPATVGVLIGGNSGRLSYTEADWLRLAAFMREAQHRFAMRFCATTSRRSGDFAGDTFAALAAEPETPLIRFIDYRVAGPGALGEVFAASDAILCTEDSTTMISEAVGARLPVVTVGPDSQSLEAREVEYRQFLAQRGWYRALTLGKLSPESFLDALALVRPRTTSQLDELAQALEQRLPDLFT